MATRNKVWRLIVGAPLDPLAPRTRHAIAVTPLLAWVGLGADGLSSSCYGPEEAFLALGQHTALALFLALATALTVFIIALGYNQVIELFPTGGGGYRVATALFGPRPGLVSGAALLVDYVLTVATSLASGVDAFFMLIARWRAPGFRTCLHNLCGGACDLCGVLRERAVSWYRKLRSAI